MVTNGTLLSRYLDRLLEADISYLDISLDGLPYVNDTWRGTGTGERVLKNLKLVLSQDPQCDLFVTSVLHQGNLEHIVEFAQALFDMGLSGFFTSPILKFTTNDKIEQWAINPGELDRIIKGLLTVVDQSPEIGRRQVVIDLPYSYAWWLLASGRVSANQIFEDIYEAPYYRPDINLPLFFKMNFLSFSYWRAVRITHNGVAIENLDLAAHPNYWIATHIGDSIEIKHARRESLAHAFHTHFLASHSSIRDAERYLFDRDVPGQLLQQIQALEVESSIHRRILT